MGPRDWLLLLALSLLWGGSFFFAKIAVAEWPPLAVVLARVGLAAAALYLAVRGCPACRWRWAAGCGSPSSAWDCSTT